MNVHSIIATWYTRQSIICLLLVCNTTCLVSASVAVTMFLTYTHWTISYHHLILFQLYYGRLSLRFWLINMKGTKILNTILKQSFVINNFLQLSILRLGDVISWVLNSFCLFYLLFIIQMGMELGKRWFVRNS